MIDVDILNNLANFEDLEQAGESLKKIKGCSDITPEEAKILVNLLVPFFNSEREDIQLLAREAFAFLKAQNPSLELPEELLDDSAAGRKMKREFAEFKKQRTAEMEAVKAAETAVPGQTPPSPVMPWDKTTVRTEKSCFWAGTKAMEAGDYEEAERSFQYTLQFNDERGDAWLGKGVAIGLKDGSPLFRIEEVVECFKKAQKFGLKEKSDREQAAKKLNSIAVSIFKQALLAWEAPPSEKAEGGKIPHAGSSKEGNPELEEGIVIPAEKSVEALRLAWSLDPCFEVAKSLALCSHLLSEVGFLNEPKKESYRMLHEQFLDEARKFDPAFSVNKGRKCFVATAATGGENNNVVVTLTRFRDLCLSASRPGRWAIALYYCLGPHAAELIHASRLLKAIALHVVVKPASRIVRIFKSGYRISCY